jgi:hypothetical protein
MYCGEVRIHDEHFSQRLRQMVSELYAQALEYESLFIYVSTFHLYFPRPLQMLQ